MSNIVKNYLKILEIISYLNIVLNTEIRAGRKLKTFENYFVVDSRPLEIFKMARHNRIKIYKDDLRLHQIKVFVHHKTPSFTIILVPKRITSAFL